MIVRDAIIGITAILIAFMMAFLPVFDAHYTQILGIACNVLTVIFFASPLATMSQVIKKKTTESMSFPLSLMSAIVTLSWTLYGYLVGDYFVIFPNALGFILAALQLYLFIIYPNTPSQSSLLP
jgi:solute carrier family 50 protein (sugar transporter)